MSTTPSLSARARQVGDAAIAVLADHGARGLTHRAVDQAAGLPPGTTSNYARTRAALLTLALARIAELDAADGARGLSGPGLSESRLSGSEVSGSEVSGSEVSGSGVSGSGVSGSGVSGSEVSGSEVSGSGVSGSGVSGSEVSGSGVSGSGLADGLARTLHWTITDAEAQRRVLARFELAFEATRRPELRAAYDDMGRRFRAEAAALLAAAGSATPERDAWTLIAWMEGTAFYALAGAGAAAAPSVTVLRGQIAGLLASMCAGAAGAA